MHTCASHAGASLFATIREATLADLPFLQQLEKTSFGDKRRSSRNSLRHSIASPTQLVLIIESPARRKNAPPAGAAIVFQYKRSLRVYSIAVQKDSRLLGLGQTLMQHIIQFALHHGYERISLEADMADSNLVAWYRKLGFEPVRTLPEYYGPGEHALRMVLQLLQRGGASDHMVVVVDAPAQVKSWAPEINFCSAGGYLSDTNYANSSRFQVLNLCNSHRTHSMGYYVSLLATARNHLIVPSVMAMKDAATPEVAQSVLDEIRDYLTEKFCAVDGAVFELTVLLGKTPSQQHGELAKKLFALFSIPFFTISLQRNGSWKLKKMKVLHLKSVLRDHPELLREALGAYCLKKRYTRPRIKKYQYDLAILVNREEPTPPSCALALEKFRKAAERVGFYAEFITKVDHRRICEFDALFIRETTAIDNHTYAMSRHAYTEGLVVVDDPWSIMLCSNKVYLYERLANAGVCQPRGWLLTCKHRDAAYLRSLPLPLVLKLPESSFSQGVFRVRTFEELQSRLTEMSSATDLVIAQEYLQSAYDWRIGLLDNTPLFACKYYMARNHWQIYNWQSGEGGEFSGRSETLPVNQVPAHVVKAAVQASSLIGNGLYGVDMKEINGKAYVIEVNDNPNVDAGIEDQLLGDELYERIMRSLYNRIEAERQQIRYLY